MKYVIVKANDCVYVEFSLPIETRDAAQFQKDLAPYLPDSDFRVVVHWPNYEPMLEEFARALHTLANLKREWPGNPMARLFIDQSFACR